MAFESQLKQSKISTRRGSKSSIVMSQSYKQSTKSEELSIRIAAKLMNDSGIVINSKVDILFDKDNNLWMIKKCKSNEGFTVSGKDGAPTALIRYTLKDGHVKLTNERADLPVKIECDESSIKHSEQGVIFKLKENNEAKVNSGSVTPSPHLRSRNTEGERLARNLPFQQEP